MKIVTNKTNEPIRVPLPRGKVLHLGPHKSGKIDHHDADHPPLKRLIEDKSIEVEDDRPAGADTRAPYDGPGRPSRF
ncbi:MAG: hypothetical protein EP299_07735 [Acidobacteria bacterium]|nr:MAG: hypothetical protein EP299_07735 [Acidobacteriota bacterium]